MRISILVFCMGFFTAFNSEATVYTIGPAGDFPSLGAAIGDATANPDNHEFRLQTGTHFGSYSFQITGEKSWVISGGWNATFTSNPTAPSATILQANLNSSVIRPDLFDTAQLQIQNLTLSDGNAMLDAGGLDSFIIGGSTLTLRDCRVSNNQTGGASAGIRVFASGNTKVNISRCEILSNTANDGGSKNGVGAFVRVSQAATLNISNSRFALNQDTTSSTLTAGAGLKIEAFDNSNTTLLETTIEDNVARSTTSRSAGIDIDLRNDARVEIEGLRVEGNDSPNAGSGNKIQAFANLQQTASLSFKNSLIINSNSDGLAVSNAGTGNVSIGSNTVANNAGIGVNIFSATGNTSLTNNIVHNNQGTALGVLVSPFVFLSNNMGDDFAGINSLNPLFVNASSDFHLQSNSPAINAGANAFNTTLADFELNPRVVNGTIDIGAYEYQFPPTDSLFGNGFENTP